MNDFAMEKSHSEKPVSLPNVNSLLKISFGLILFTMVSFALVYAETIPVDVGENSFDVEYDVTGMTISSIEADSDFISLILTVDVTASNGILNITLDRSFFDSTFEGLDDDFIILADGEEPAFSETNTTSESRTLRIELSAGNEEIEIIGSVFGDSDSITVTDTDDAAAAKAVADAAAAKAVADAAAAKAVADAAAAKAVADAAAAKAVADAAAAKAVADAAAAKAVADAAASQTQSTQCGPGTILQNGVCVLDERCGPGTLLQDGVCVLDSTSAPSGSSVGGMGKEMVIGVIIAFVVAGIVAVVFGIMSKASKSSS